MPDSLIKPQTDDGMVYTWDEVAKMPVVETKFYLEHYVPVEGIVLLYGKYGTYKTPLTVNIAKAIATGQPAFGLESSQASPLLFVELDTPRQVILPRLQLIDLKDVPADFAFCYPGFDVISPTSTPWSSQVYCTLAKAHKEKGYKVVIVDALRGIHNLPAEDSSTPPQVYRNLALLFPKAVIMVIHHDRKTKFEKGIGEKDKEEMDHESFSGSQAWINHATVAIKIEHQNKKRKEVRLLHTKSQASELQPPIVLKVSEGSRFNLASEVNYEQLLAVWRELPVDSTTREKDEAVAQTYGFSVRTAQRRRLDYEKMVEAQPIGNDRLLLDSDFGPREIN